jgi:ferric-dicitrate binding protein FerR (iron transport regulator)
MGSVRQPEDERIPVAAPRPARHERSPRRRLVDASGAGLTLIVIIAAFALLGAWAGGTIGIPIAGALATGFLGLLAGFAGIYWRYRDL